MQENVRRSIKGSLGVIELVRPNALNALSFSMICTMQEALVAWEKDDRVKMVFMHSADPRAFCVGGDVRALALALKDQPAALDAAQKYFLREYQTDLLIHRYKKPILCWGESWVLGGGWGLFAGASHRVVTKVTQLAMPETAIGFFPDVAASWFFKVLPLKLSIFLAMTGARVTAAEAIAWGLADHILPAQAKPQILEALSTADWGKATDDKINTLLKSTSVDPGEKEICHENDPTDFEKLDRKIYPGDPDLTLELVKKWKPNNANWRAAIDQLRGYSDYYPLLAHRLFSRPEEITSAHMAFERDLQIAISLVQKADFVEAVLAKLVEKRPAQWLNQDTKGKNWDDELAKLYDPTCPNLLNT